MMMVWRGGTATKGNRHKIRSTKSEIRNKLKTRMYETLATPRPNSRRFGLAGPLSHRGGGGGEATGAGAGDGAAA